MSNDLPMDENLRGLLIEIAEQPEELSFASYARSFQDLVVRPRTGMGPFEAKLLEAHRGELAHLLAQASWIQLDQAQKSRLLVPRDSAGRPQPVDPARWRRAAVAYGKGPAADAEPQGAMGLLRRVVASGPGGPSPREIAVASLRLVPKTSTTLLVAILCALEGDRQRGIEISRSALDDSIDGYHAAYAWATISGLASKLGRFHDAMEAGRQATYADPGLLRGPVAWLLSAVQAGSRMEAMSAKHALMDCLNSRDALQEYVKLVREGRTCNLWAPTPEGRSLARQLHDHVPEEAEGFLETFL